MKVKTTLIIILVASAAVWLAVLYRVTALATGKIGPVTVAWSDISKPSAVFGWYPGLSAYTFNSAAYKIGARSLKISPGKTVTFQVKLPAAYSSGSLKLRSSGSLNLEPALGSGENFDTTKITWSKMTKQNGVYRFVVKNNNQAAVTLQQVILTLKP